MSKTLIQAIAIAAMLLSPSLASARVGSGVSVSSQVGHVGVRLTEPRIRSDLKLSKCHVYQRRNQHTGDLENVTICPLTAH